MTAKGWQVIQVDYNNKNDLRFKLAGVDTVISTISGASQLALIDAAAQAHVRRFVPSEFEGSPTARPPNDVLDRGRRAALTRLQHYKQCGMEYTVFTCGIFYERFAPGGMSAFQIGLSSAISGEGDYVMNLRTARAQIPYYNAAGQPVYVCMTSAKDVARFVVAALDLPHWPAECRMRGDRMSLSQVVAIGEHLRGKLSLLASLVNSTNTLVIGVEFERANYTKESLQDALTYAEALGDEPRQSRIYNLIATAEGRYDYNAINLNGVVDISPQRFRDFLAEAWSP